MTCFYSWSKSHTEYLKYNEVKVESNKWKISEVISKVKKIWEELNQEYIILRIVLNKFPTNYKNLSAMKGTK